MSTLYIKYPAALAGPGTGDVVGPGSSTDNAVARFDGTTGKLLQNSGVIIDDSNNVVIPGLVTCGTSAGNSSSILTIGTATHSLSGSIQRGALSNMTFTSAATGQAHAFQASPQTAAAAFTAAAVTGFNSAALSVGAGSAVTRYAAFLGNNPSGATNNACFTDDAGLSFSGNFGIYMVTTNPSSLAGAIATKRGDVASTATITAMASSTSFVRITGSTITAIQGIAAGIDGQRLVVFNNAGVAVTFANENAGATAANRITTMTGADVATVGNGAAELIYDTGSSRWILLYVTA